MGEFMIVLFFYFAYELREIFCFLEYFHYQMDDQTRKQITRHVFPHILFFIHKLKEYCNIVFNVVITFTYGVTRGQKYP